MTAIAASSALVSVLAMAPLQDAAAQRFQCYPIRPGDTAATVARRLTGDHLNRRASWFQIVDGRGRVVSKADYVVIRAGWRACLAVGPPQTAFQPFGRPDAAPVSEQRTAVAGDTPVWWLAPLGLAVLCASLAAALFAVNSWKKRRALAQIMRRFGGDFVREFGRPWMQYPRRRSIAARAAADQSESSTSRDPGLATPGRDLPQSVRSPKQRRV